MTSGQITGLPALCLGICFASAADGCGWLPGKGLGEVLRASHGNSGHLEEDAATCYGWQKSQGSARQLTSNGHDKTAMLLMTLRTTMDQILSQRIPHVPIRTLYVSLYART